MQYASNIMSLHSGAKRCSSGSCTHIALATKLPEEKQRFVSASATSGGNPEQRLVFILLGGLRCATAKAGVGTQGPYVSCFATDQRLNERRRSAVGRHTPKRGKDKTERRAPCM